MKNRKFVMVFLVTLFAFNSSQAQILRQTQRQAMNNASNKGQNEADKNMEQTMKDAILNYGKNKVDPSNIPNEYAFSWKYFMEIKTSDDKAMKMEYFLEPEASYFGINIGESEAQKMLMIMDAKNNISITAFGDGKEKMAKASKLPDYSEMDKKGNAKSKFTYKTLPDKTFLGYSSKGLQVTNDEYDIIFYYTNEAKVSFSDLFKNQKNINLPEAFTNYFKEGERPLMMDMSMKDLKNKGKVTTMKCISLEKYKYVFKKSDYKFM